MNGKISRVLVFAAGGLSIGYAMQQGYRHFFAVEEPWKLLGYLSVFVTTGLAGLGLHALANFVGQAAGPRARPRSTTTSR
jgi:hypothetical protein